MIRRGSYPNNRPQSSITYGWPDPILEYNIRLVGSYTKYRIQPAGWYTLYRILPAECYSWYRIRPAGWYTLV